MTRIDHRLPSAIAAGLVLAGICYLLATGLAASFVQPERERISLIELAPDRPPPAPEAKAAPVVPRTARTVVPPGTEPVILKDWSTASPEQRNLDFVKATQWVKDNMPEEDRRLIRWRAELPQGSGPARVTRLQPANLTTHTLYWPASWSKGRLPIIAWGNGQDGKCANSSLPYAAFLAEIASHGYFVVAVGNDDIDYPQPEGLEILADGRPIRTQASALTKAVDWAIAENSRAGSPYAGRLDTGRIAYMGHGCGGGQAIAAGADARTATIVVLSGAARFNPDASAARKAPIAQFDGAEDDREVLTAGDANLARAQAAGWPMVRAALAGMGHDTAYPGPDRRWSRAVIAWLDWKLRDSARAGAAIERLAQNGWKRVGIATPGGAPVEAAGGGEGAVAAQ